MPLGRTVHHPRHSKVEHVPRRSESTLDALYREHASAARRYATTLTRSPEEAEDLMTGALLRVLAAIRRGEAPETGVRSFLFATMRRVQVEEARRPFAVHPVESSGDAGGKPSRSSLVRGPHHNQSTVDRDTVTAAFRGLPARWQAALVLTAADHRSLEEVADRLDISPAAASVLAFRAREGLRASYLEHGLQPAPDVTCAPMRARLGRWGRRTLTEEERRDVNDHLRTCVDCDAAALWVTEESARVGFVPIPVLLAAVWPSAKNLGAIGPAGGGITAPGALRISRGALVSAGTVVLVGAVSAAVALSPVGEWLSGSAAPHTPSGSSSLGSGADTPSATSPALSPPVATSGPTTATATKSASPPATSARSSSSSSSSSPSPAVTSSQVWVVYSSAGRSAVVWRSMVPVGTVLQLSGLPAGTAIGGSASCAAAAKAVDFTCTVEGVDTTSIALSARGWWCSPVGTNSSGANGSANGHRLRFACSRL